MRIRLVTAIKQCSLTLSLLFFANCVAPVDIPVEKIGGQAVIAGMISTIAEQNIIRVGLTADTERLPIPLSGASVKLVDDVGGEYFYQEDPYHPGNYLLPDVSGVPGRTYYIEVFADGREYRSNTEKIPASPGLVGTHYTFTEEEFVDNEGIISTEYFIKVFADAELPPNLNELYFQWTITEDFLLSPTDFPDPFGNIPPPCFVAQDADPQRISLLRGADLNTTSLTGQLIASRIVDWTFFERHYFTTYQSSITKNAYDYWKKINVLATQVGSIFDLPPAKAQGNIYNIDKPDQYALGYFLAANQEMHRFFLLPFDIPFNIPARPCTFDNRPNDQYAQRCLDCPSIRNSSYRRPPWF
jgi:hypothetical protein